MIRVSVPGKIHLLGEHSVVYGKPALLAAINQHVTVSIKSFSNGKGFREFDETKTKLEKVLVNAIRKKFKTTKILPYTVEISYTLPIGAGLGSSASFSAAAAGALLTFLKLPNDKKTIFEIAYEGEKFFHGNPSGGDLTVVINGGFVYFRKEFEFLKLYSPLPFTSHKIFKRFFLVDSGKPIESTRELVEKVARLRSKKSRLIDALFDSQEILTKQLTLALKNGDERLVIESIQQGELNLEQLGVVGKKAQKIIHEIEKVGGAAKIMGGGGIKEGSGMLLVYLKSNANAHQLENFTFKPITISMTGLTIHE